MWVDIISMVTHSMRVHINGKYHIYGFAKSLKRMYFYNITPSNAGAFYTKIGQHDRCQTGII